ncbi:MAG: hypothetical protein K2I10_07690 [Lachnospiraceae bacterium]|nr:hypothetical protein [Lachnospiraceae bacterium]
MAVFFDCGIDILLKRHIAADPFTFDSVQFLKGSALGKAAIYVGNQKPCMEEIQNAGNVDDRRFENPH